MGIRAFSRRSWSRDEKDRRIGLVCARHRSLMVIGRERLDEPPPNRAAPTGRRYFSHADRDRRPCRLGQDDRLQHADPRPRRDRRVRRHGAARRRRQGARRAARPAGRDLQAEEDRPRRRHVRRPAGAAGLVRGPRRDGGAAGRAPRPPPRVAMRCSTSSGRSRTTPIPIRRARSTRGATSTGSTSSSSSPTSRSSTGGSSG